MKRILGQRTTVFSFYVILIFVMLNYVNNIMAYRGWDIVQLFHPAKIMLLSDLNVNSPYGFYFMQFYPLLVVLPAGFSFYYDCQYNEVIFWCTRLGRKNYFIGKIIAVFFSSFLIFAVPLLFELLLNYISFPVGAVGDPVYTLYDPAYREAVESYFLAGVYLRSSYLYAVVCIIFISVVSGIFNMFTVAISTFRIRFKVLLFLPVYILLYVMTMLGQRLGFSFSTSYYSYLTFYNIDPKNSLFFIGIVVLLGVFSVIVMVANCRRGWMR